MLLVTSQIIFHFMVMMKMTMLSYPGSDCNSFTNENTDSGDIVPSSFNLKLQDGDKIWSTASFTGTQRKTCSLIKIANL